MNSNLDSVEATPSTDLTPVLAQYLDSHLLLPVLDHIADQTNDESVLAASLELAEKTKLLQTIASLRSKLNLPALDIEPKQAELHGQLEALSASAQPVMNAMDDLSTRESLGSDKSANLALLEQRHGINTAQIEALYKLGQFEYASGLYAEAAQTLALFRNLSVDSQLNLSAQWGKLAADTLSGNWQAAQSELQDLKENIDRTSSLIQALHQRTWLLHWSLFLFFHADSGRQNLLELFFATPYLSTVQTAAPHLTRYLVAAIFLTFNRAAISSHSSGAASQINALTSNRDISRMIAIVSQERHRYTDDLLGLVHALFVDFDFVKAQGCLTRLDSSDGILANDFFLHNFKSVIVDRARLFIGEVYCRIHQRIDLSDLCTRLHLSAEEGEKWLVNLIKDTRLDGKIDYKSNVLTTTPYEQSPLQAIIEKTRGMSVRSQAISIAIDRKVHPSEMSSNQYKYNKGDRGNNNRRQQQSAHGASGSTPAPQAQSAVPASA